MCAFLLIKLHFGHYVSKDKCFLRPVRQLQVLGLILDTARHSWMVPPSKSAHCCARLSAVITSLRAAPAQPARLDFRVMASLAGTAMSLLPALPRLRFFHNLQHCFLSGAPLKDAAGVVGPAPRHAWWDSLRPASDNVVRRVLRAPLTRELARCLELVSGSLDFHGQPVHFPFETESKTLLCATLSTDSTLSGEFATALFSPLLFILLLLA